MYTLIRTTKSVFCFVMKSLFDMPDIGIPNVCNIYTNSVYNGQDAMFS